MDALDMPTMKAIATSTRKEIVKLLRERPYTASELSKILDKHVTTISEHLDVLENSGLVIRKEGNKWVYYNLTSKGQNLFRPNYSWAVMFSMFFLIAAAGTYLYTSSQNAFIASEALTGVQETPDTAQRTSGELEALTAAQEATSAVETTGVAQKAAPVEQSAPAQPPAAEPMNPDAILGLTLAVIGIAGIAYVAIRNLRANTLRNARLL